MSGPSSEASSIVFVLQKVPGSHAVLIDVTHTTQSVENCRCFLSHYTKVVRDPGVRRELMETSIQWLSFYTDQWLCPVASEIVELSPTHATRMRSSTSGLFNSFCRNRAFGIYPNNAITLGDVPDQ